MEDCDLSSENESQRSFLNRNSQANVKRRYPDYRFLRSVWKKPWIFREGEIAFVHIVSPTQICLTIFTTKMASEMDAQGAGPDTQGGEHTRARCWIGGAADMQLRTRSGSLELS